MSKKYLDKNVYDAAVERFNFIFDEFDTVCLSFSGGKDSTVALHLCDKIARERNRQFYVLFIDLEGQYKVTIEHVEEMMSLPTIKHFFWICLPVNLRNAVSVFEPHWCCWNPSKKKYWVRDVPQHEGVVSSQDFFPFYWFRMEFEEFTPRFAHWLLRESGGEKLASIVAIRADESLNRYRTIVRKRESRYRNRGWTTRIDDPDKRASIVYNAYPIYDWRTEDVWSYLGKNGLSYNRLYDWMYLNGMSIHNMRICQPYGDDQRKGLDQFHAIEPDTWYRIIQRVSGSNYGARYAGQKMLGYHRGLGLPEGHTWESYTRLLLGTMPEKTQEHFKIKFAVFMQWWEDHPSDWWLENNYPEFPDEAPRKLEAKKKAPSWRRMAMCILKNDFWCKSLSFAMTRNVYRDYYRELEVTGKPKIKPSVKEKYRSL